MLRIVMLCLAAMLALASTPVLATTLPHKGDHHVIPSN